MLETSNPSIDINALLDRIRKEVARHKQPAASEKESDRPPTLANGSVIHFGKDGNAEAFIRSGWSEAEAEHQWTDGREAEIHFEVAHTDADLLLTFSVSPLIGPKTVTQHVQAEWNGRLVGEWSIRKPGTYATIVWARHLQGSLRVHLRFVLMSAFSPISEGLSSDPRMLGLCFREFRLLPVSDLGI